MSAAVSGVHHVREVSMDEPGEGLLPPHDLGAEVAVLSILLMEPTLVAKTRAALRPADFFGEPHRRIFAALLAVHDRGGAVDVVTVASHLRSSGELVAIGGGAYLTRIINDSSAWTGHLMEYVQLVEQRARARRAIEAGRLLMAQGYAGTEAIDDVLAQARAALEGLRPPAALSPEVPWESFGAEAIDAPIEAVPWLVPGLKLAPGPVTMWAGYGYSRKTVAAQDLLLSVAAGVDVFGTYRARRGRVLHLDCEQGNRLTRARYKRLARAKGINLAELPPDQIRVACYPGIDLAAPGTEDTFLRACEGVTLTLIDSLAASCSIEEKDSAIRRPLDTLARVSEKTGCTLLMIHHARKPPGDGETEAKFSIRGSAALFDACAGVYVFGAKKDEDFSKVEHLKERNEGLVLEDFGVRTMDVQGDDGDPRWGLRISHVDREEMKAPAEGRLDAGRLEETVSKVTQVIQLSGPMPLRQLRSRVGGRKETTDDAIDLMMKDGRLVMTKGERGAHIFSLNYSTVLDETRRDES